MGCSSVKDSFIGQFNLLDSKVKELENTKKDANDFDIKNPEKFQKHLSKMTQLEKEIRALIPKVEEALNKAKIGNADGIEVKTQKFEELKEKANKALTANERISIGEYNPSK